MTGAAVQGQGIWLPRMGAPAAETSAALGGHLAAAVLEAAGLPGGSLRRRQGRDVGGGRGG
jgi:hypothetical protein